MHFIDQSHLNHLGARTVKIIGNPLKGFRMVGYSFPSREQVSMFLPGACDKQASGCGDGGAVAARRAGKELKE